MINEELKPYYSISGKSRGKQFVDCPCGYPVEVGPGKTNYKCPICLTELKMDASGGENVGLIRLRMRFDSLHGRGALNRFIKSRRNQKTFEELGKTFGFTRQNAHVTWLKILKFHPELK